MATPVAAILRLALVPILFMNVIILIFVLDAQGLMGGSDSDPSTAAWLLASAALLGLLIVPGVLVTYRFRPVGFDAGFLFLYGCAVALVAWGIELAGLVVVLPVLIGPPVLAADSGWNVAGCFWFLGVCTTPIVGFVSTLTEKVLDHRRAVRPS
jgi:hypothetical protein